MPGVKGEDAVTAHLATEEGAMVFDDLPEQPNSQLKVGGIVADVEELGELCVADKAAVCSRLARHFFLLHVFIVLFEFVADYDVVHAYNTYTVVA